MPPGLKTVGDYAFFGCKGLKRAVLNEGLDVLGTSVFENSALKHVVLPSTLRRIGNCAFRGCGYLKGITLQEGLRDIGSRSFEDTGIRELLVPCGVRCLGSFAFASCRQLRKVSFAGGSMLEEVGDGTFCWTLLRPGDISFPGRARVSESALSEHEE